MNVSEKIRQDMAATRLFSIRTIITSHCSQLLTPEMVDLITQEVFKEIESGPTSWAFGQYPNPRRIKL